MKKKIKQWNQTDPRKRPWNTWFKKISTTFLSAALVMSSLYISTPVVAEAATTWTSGNVTLTVSATDSGSGVAYYKLGSGSWQTSNIFTVSTNGTYTIYVEDAVGNVASKTSTVSNIDKTAPTINSITESTDDETTSDITLTVDAEDSASGLATNAYSIDGSTYQSSDEFTVTENGTYTIYVKDVVGNISSDSITVSNIDKNGPEISSITEDTEDWTNGNITLTVTASDDGAGLADYAYSIDGSTFQESNEFTVTENATYTIYVQDSLGNVSTGSITVSNIDKDNPTISSVSESPTGWTNENITLTVDASDSGSGLADEAYSIDGDTYQSSNEFTITVDGTYTIYVKDNAGNTNTEIITISNIDTDNPYFSSITESTTDWTNENVTLTVDANDDLSGVAGYSLDGNNYQTSDELVVSDNDTYTVYLKDNAGNVASEDTMVSNIDKVDPVISDVTESVTGQTDEDLTVTITADDADSKLADEAYSLDGETYQSSNEFTISENGTYTIYVKDNAGNVATASFTISNIDKTAPVITSFDLSETDYVQSETITVNATDNVEVASYSEDGEIYQNSNVFDINANGDYTYYVQDTAGNISSATTTVTNIDLEAPVLADVTFSTTDYTNEDIEATINATDEKAGVSGYSLDGETYQDSNVFTISENGNYEYYVIDNAGNVAEGTFTVSNIDKTSPVIDSLTENTTDPTNQDIEITVTASDNVEVSEYRIDSGSWQDSSVFAVSSNGTYIFECMDEAGNVSDETSITVGNIDLDDPYIESISVSTEDWTNEAVEITIIAADDSSSVAGYSLDGETWSTTNVLSVTENGTYDVYVKDAAGNIYCDEDAITISNIDTTSPVITSIDKSTSDITNEDITITINATDEASGILGYSIDGENYQESNEFTIEDNDTYTVYVIDNAGNVGTNNVDITNIDKTGPDISSIAESITSQTNSNVSIIVSAVDDLSGIAGYSLDGVTYQDSNELAVTTNGNYTVYVIDNVGNVSTGTITISNIDTTSPVIVSIESSNTDYTNDDITLTVTATDDVAIAGYSIDGSEYSETNTFDISENGSYTLYVEDTAGNITTGAITISNIDKVAPIVNGITADLEETNQDLYITVNATDNVSVSYYRIDDGDWQDSNVFPIETNGEYTIECMDEAENISDTYTFNIANIDKEAPTIVSVDVSGNDVSGNDSTTTYTNQDVYITVTSTDNVGVVSYLYDSETGEWVDANTYAYTENGTYTIYVKDAAGNITSTTITISNIDKEVPVIDSIDESTTDLTNEDVTVTVNATDNTGIAGYSMDGITYSDDNTFSIAENGDYTFYVEDLAGNVSEAVKTISNIDKTIPVISGVNESTTEYTNSEITLSVLASDDSGIAGYSQYDGSGYNDWTTDNTFTVTTNGTYTFEALDEAGNISEEYSVEISNIDTEAPVLVSATENETEETAGSITITVSGTDNNSVLYYRDYTDDSDPGEWQSENTFTESENGTYKFQAKDAAGNISNTISIKVSNIDNEIPVINSVTESTNETTNKPITLTVSASDNIGIASYYINGVWQDDNSASISESGTYNIYVKDTVGNISEVYTVEITNYDDTAPTITDIDTDTTTSASSETITITAEDSSGDVTYSMDDETWQTSNTFTITANGTYTFYVKDAAGNVATCEVTYTNIVSSSSSSSSSSNSSSDDEDESDTTEVVDETDETDETDTTDLTSVLDTEDSNTFTTYINSLTSTSSSSNSSSNDDAITEVYDDLPIEEVNDTYSASNSSEDSADSSTEDMSSTTSKDEVDMTTSVVESIVGTLQSAVSGILTATFGEDAAEIITDAVVPCAAIPVVGIGVAAVLTKFGLFIPFLTWIKKKFSWFFLLFKKKKKKENEKAGNDNADIYE